MLIWSLTNAALSYKIKSKFSSLASWLIDWLINVSISWSSNCFWMFNLFCHASVSFWKSISSWLIFLILFWFWEESEEFSSLRYCFFKISIWLKRSISSSFFGSKLLISFLLSFSYLDILLITVSTSIKPIFNSSAKAKDSLNKKKK